MRRVGSQFLQSASRLGLGIRGREVAGSAAGASAVRGTGAPSLGWVGLAAVVCAGVLLLAQAPAAHGAANYSHTGEFGGAGTANGLFRDNPAPQRIALHDASGKLFVADRGNDRVQVFVPSGDAATFAFSIATPKPVGIAIDQQSGSLYVSNEAASPLPEGIQKFTPDDPDNPTSYTLDGTFVSPVKGTGVGQITQLMRGDGTHSAAGGLAVAPNGDLVAADVGRQAVHRFTSTGTYVSSFSGCADEPFPGYCLSTERPAFVDIRDIAVGGDGVITVAERRTDGGRIDRYNANGTLAGTLSKQNNPVPNVQLADFNGDSGIALAADPDNSEVFVSSVSGSFFTPIPTQIFQFDGNAFVKGFTVEAAFESHFNQGSIHGMAAGSTSKRFYALSGQSSPFFGTAPGPFRVQAFRSTQPPTVVANVADDVSATGAVLSGSVNPNDEVVKWRFKYRRVGSSTWQNAPAPDGDVPVGASPVPVEQILSGLEPNTPYEFVLSASAGTVTSETAPQTFTTLIGSPVVDTINAAALTDTKATLNAGVNPRNTATGYHFEWGQTTDYGNRTPDTDDQPVGAGGTRTVVSQRLTGLLAATTYHFRIVATNTEGQRSEGEDHTFTTLAMSQGGLQGQRGYELATRQPLGFPTAADRVAAADHGDSVVYGANLTDSPIPGYDKPYRRMLAERGEAAWAFRPIDLPDPGQVTFRSDVYLPADLSRVFSISPVGHDPDDQNGKRDLYLNLPGEDPLWITRSETIPAGEPQTDPAVAGSMVHVASPEGGAVARDVAAIAFASKRPLTANDPNPPSYGEFYQGHPVGPAGARLYKWKDGELTLISVRPDGSTPVGADKVKLGGTVQVGAGNFDANSPHAMSADGDRVFWSDETSVFVHLDGEERSRLVGNGTYVDALPDGSRAFFTSGGRMYSYDVATTVVRDLTGPAQVAGPVAVAETGRKIYFVGRVALDVEPSPRGLPPVGGAPNLYVTTLDGDGVPADTRFVATLGGGDAPGQLGTGDSAIWDPRLTQRAATVSPDGRVLSFGSQASLTGQPVAAGGMRQAFVYDDEARSLVCVSCPADGSVPRPHSVNSLIGGGGVEAASNFVTSGWQSYLTAKRLVSSDGTVFFDTQTPLLGADENLVRDVYEYRNGELRLLTTGRPDAGPSIVAGASVSGSTVFVVSAEQYDPRDIEPGFRKVWAFRVGGGFEYNGPMPGCSGQGCDGDLQQVPEVPPIGSDGLRGQGNLVDERTASKVSLSVRQARGAKGAAVSVRVTAPGAGRITVTGKGVRKATKRTSRAGGYTIEVRLSGTSSKALADRGTLSARVKVSFKPKAGKAQAKRLKLKFKQPSTGKGGRR